MANLNNVEAELSARAQWVLDKSEGRFWIESGHRSKVEQQRLYDLHEKYPNIYPPANFPGTSKHELTPAEAVDIACNPADNALRAQLFEEAGLHTPHPKEPWHAELAPNRGPLPFEHNELPQEGDDEMPSYADQIEWPDGSKVQALPGGAVKCFGAPFMGSMFDLEPVDKKNFDVASNPIECITKNNPTDKSAGYTLWCANGDPYGFTPDVWAAIQKRQRS